MHPTTKSMMDYADKLKTMTDEEVLSAFREQARKEDLSLCITAFLEAASRNLEVSLT